MGRRVNSVVVGAAVLGLLLAGGLVGYGLGRASVAESDTEPLPAVRPPSELGVPDVVGDELGEAGDRLVGLGFDVGFRQPPSGEGTGRVEVQVPEAGRIVERGSLVVLSEGRLVP